MTNAHYMHSFFYEKSILGLYNINKVQSTPHRQDKITDKLRSL